MPGPKGFETKITSREQPPPGESGLRGPSPYEIEAAELYDKLLSAGRQDEYLTTFLPKLKEKYEPQPMPEVPFEGRAPEMDPKLQQIAYIVDQYRSGNLPILDARDALTRFEGPEAPAVIRQLFDNPNQADMPGAEPPQPQPGGPGDIPIAPLEALAYLNKKYGPPR